MAEIRQVLMPDIGDYKNVPVIEIMVKAGDVIQAEQPLLTLETDKATMDVPAPFGGVVKQVYISAGDKISEGTPILSMETSVTETAVVDELPAAPSEPAGGSASRVASQLRHFRYGPNRPHFWTMPGVLHFRQTSSVGTLFSFMSLT